MFFKSRAFDSVAQKVKILKFLEKEKLMASSQEETLFMYVVTVT